MQPVKTILFLIAACCNAFVGTAKDEVSAKNFRQQSSLLFIENKGQITDQHGIVRSDIDFKLQAPGLTMFIGNGQVHYQWSRSEKQKEKVKTGEVSPNGQSPNTREKLPPFPQMEPDEEHTITTCRMDVTLIGADRNAQLVAEEQDSYYENHITRATGEKGVVAHTYRKLTYKNIYPNIDWVLYVGTGEVLKYDFVVHPGGNANDIQLRYDGATELKLHNGALTAITTYGSITENAPYTYNAETNQQVASAFVLNGNTLSFRVENKARATLVIDPQLHWATYYGGAMQDYLYHVTGDDSGYVYGTGWTYSVNNIATTGAYQDTLPLIWWTSSQYYCAFIVKLSDAGVRQWGTYYYPGCRLWLYSGKFKGGLYLCGRADTSAIPVMGTTGTEQPGHGGGVYDGVLVKFTKNGMPEWMTYVGGSSWDHVYDLDIDGNGDLIIGGHTQSSNNMASTNAHQTTISSAFYSGFVAKYSPQGVRKWGTYYGDTWWTHVSGVTVDKWNNIYISGSTDDTAGIATPGTHKDSAYFAPNNSNGYWEEGFIAKFDASGKRLWGTYVGGPGRDYLWGGLDCDDSGNVYTSGWTESTTGIATPGAYKTMMPSTNYAGMMMKFDSSGQRKWGTYLDSNYYSGYYGGLTIHNNTLYLSGSTGNTSDIATPDAAQLALKGQSDLYILKFSTEGKKTWGSYFGGSGEEYNNGGYGGNNAFVNTWNGSTNIYLHGHTSNSYDVSTFNCHQFTHGGSHDGFIAKLTEDTLVSINSEIPLYACVGDTIQLGYRTTYSFRNGNLFTAELSDDTGGFANPITIGSVVSDTTGEMTCVIPLNTPRGDRYRIRVTASLRGDTSVQSVNKIYINNIYPQDFSATSNSPVCLEDTIRFSATSTSHGIQYSWKGVYGFHDTGANPVIANAATTNDGEYIVTANLYGCKARDTVTVSTKPLPYTNIINHDAIAQNLPCEADTLKLITSDANPGTTYSWTGPAGFSSTTQNPKIAPVPLTYNGRFIITTTLNGCEQKDTLNAQVKPLPQNLSTSATGPVCSGTNVQLSATSTSAGVTWKWEGPNSFTTTLQNPVILAAQPIHNGDYIVTATLNGCAIKDTVTAVVNVIPDKPIINTNTPVCEKDSLHFSVTNVATGASYSWAGPQAFTGSKEDTVFEAGSVNASGQYTLTVSKDGCSNSENITVLVKPLPAAVSVSNNGPICEGNTLQLSSGTSTTGSAYSWAGPGNFGAGTQNTSVSSATPATSGWYKMTVTLRGCLFTDSTLATVNEVPVLSNITANQPICLGETLNLSAGNINNAIYSWYGPGAFTASGRTPAKTNLQYADTGWYRVIATANNCVSAPDSVYVKANPVPFVVISANKDSICQGDAVQFTALPNQHAGTPVFVWKVNGTTTGTGLVYNTSALNDGDVISCSMTENTKCSAPYTDQSNDVTMSVLQWKTPAVSIVAAPNTPVKVGQQVMFTASPVNGGILPKYQWKRNGNNVQGATGAIWSASTLSDNDEICVEMTSSYMCPQPATVKSNCINVKILTGIYDNQLAGMVSLHPNPNNGRFVLSGQVLQTITGAVKIEVLNTLGQVVHKDELETEGGRIYKEIQLPQVANGTYMLRVYNTDISHTMKFNVR